MDSKNEESSNGQQGDAAIEVDPGPPPSTPVAPLEHPTPSFHAKNLVLKSGPLLLSTKGIGWTSWKKRWFILTRTSLVFFRSDPTAIPPKGGNEVNLTLGGIDLNNSGSVVVKADKKLITVLFEDGEDGKNFTLKAFSHISGFEGRNAEQKALIMCLSDTAETSEDLYEWKAAFENAFSQAPSSSHVMGKNGISRNDKADAVDGSKEPVNGKQPVISTVIGKPILLALEDADGAPTFLEKALRYVEEHGTKAEGVLRQAADVEDVKRRIQEYEQGKTELTSEEDPHVIADCVKYVIRELPSSPVPASCCNALLEASRSESGGRVDAMRVAILDTFPEPNRRLLQRILKMMQAVASHRAENLMNSSAVAACMAPLLLRPLLAGNCEIEIGFDVDGDSSFQLLQAVAAANHAQAIVTTLLEEYDKIFGEWYDVSPHLYSETEESGIVSRETTDDDCDDAKQGSDALSDNDYVASGTGRKSGHPVNNDLDIDSDYSSPSSRHSSLSKNDLERSKDNQSSNSSAIKTNKFAERPKDAQGVTKLEDKLNHHNQISCIPKSASIRIERGHNVKRPAVWGWAAAKKKLSMERIDSPRKEEANIENIEAEKSDLQKTITEQVEGKTIHEASLVKQKKTLHERRLALQIDLSRLEEELQRERDKRTSLEAGLMPSQGPVFLPDILDEKTKTDLNDIAQAEADINNLNKTVDDLQMQLNQLLEQNSVSLNNTSNRHQPDHQSNMKDKPKDAEAALKKSVSKGKYVDKVECENEKQEPSSANEQNINRTRADETTARNSPALVNAKKSALKGEGVNSPTSALAKLTTRLSFLKERRNQNAKEVEKGQRSIVPSQDKTKTTQPIQAAQNQEKTTGPDKSGNRNIRLGPAIKKPVRAMVFYRAEKAQVTSLRITMVALAMGKFLPERWGFES
ncbi:Rho GTPase-activating protein REN1 [Hibiscus syriacus]|uniref:Rho GTPase-activating protein REN1 n=1 Tax=Hibiscus syriacus TaxID=106335 RepID=A0A6A3BE94_HIBSY|nr:Rho GTPase-activating protein REN1 [Hibiscus syriacus]